MTTWISCKDRLPPVSGRYLVAINYARYANVYAFNIDTKKWSREQRPTHHVIVAWTDLPLTPHAVEMDSRK